MLFEMAAAVLKNGVNRSPISENNKRSRAAKIRVTAAMIDKWTTHLTSMPMSANQYSVVVDRTTKSDT